LIHGGVGIVKDVNVGGTLTVGGNTTINGNLFVNGTRTEIDTTVLTVKDNIMLVCSGPSGSADSGYAMKRYQLANDTALGDVVNDDTPEVTGTCQTGSTASTIVLAANASAVDDFYAGAWVLISSGTGADQVRRIKSYDGTTKTATIYTSSDQATLAPTPVEGIDFTTTPDDTSHYSIFTGQYVLTIWDELRKEYAVGNTPIDPVSQPIVTIRNYINIHGGNLDLDDTAHVDTIVEHTTNAGVTVEGVLLKDGNVSNVTTLNGGSVPTTVTVTLVDNLDILNNAVQIVGMNKYGTYLVQVQDKNNPQDGATACFIVSANSNDSVVNSYTMLEGSNGELLSIVWGENDYPKLGFETAFTNGTGQNVDYTVRFTSTI
jgi:hypothetical protein